jgi:hypothetical protein
VLCVCVCLAVVDRLVETAEVSRREVGGWVRAEAGIAQDDDPATRAASLSHRTNTTATTHNAHRRPHTRDEHQLPSTTQRVDTRPTAHDSTLHPVPLQPVVAMTRRLLLAATLLACTLTLALGEAPLDLQSSSNALCPVITYSVSVEEVTPQELSTMKLTALLQDQAAAAPATQSKPYKVIVTPLAYAHNASIPSVDWIDLHFRVNDEIQQNVQMKATPAAASTSSHLTSSPLPSAGVAPELDSSMMSSSGVPSHSGVASQYSFGPIFLAPSDELS